MLVDEWGGGHLVKGDEKEEEVPSSLGEAQADRADRENQLDENQMFETKEEMRGDGELIQKEKLRKRGVEDGKKKKKSGVPKPVADEIGAKKKKKKRKGKNTKKEKGKHAKKGKGKHTKKTKLLSNEQEKTGPKKKSRSQMCDTKCLEKKRLQLKAKVEKLKKQRSKIRKEIKSLNKRKFHGKELNGKETSRATECCNDKWANYTSLVIGLAPNVIKQVGKFIFFKS